MKSNRKLESAAGYIRMSSNKQEDSPKRQRREIEILAEREGYRIVEWYEDHGLTGTKSKNRPGFQKLLADAQAGKFRAVLVHEHSRFSREDVFEALHHFQLLRDCNVKLVTSARGEVKMDDLAGMLMMMIDQHGARSESLKIADRCLSGKLVKAESGIRMGRAPLGYDREIINAKGEVICRVAYGERFQAPPGARSRLVPAGDVALTDFLRKSFKAFAAGKATYRGIAVELNKLGYRTFFGRPHVASDMRRLLSNPVYAGVYRFGHVPQGAFSRVDGEPIVKEGNHPALVSMEVFRAVQVRIESKAGRYEIGEAGRFLLAGGLIECSHCGRKIYGCHCLMWESKKPFGLYRCTGSTTGLEECTIQPFVEFSVMEKEVLRIIREEFLNETYCQQLVNEAVRLENQPEPHLEDDQIRELTRKINRATENLALAEAKDFDGIAKIIEGWRRQVEELEARRQARAKRRPASKDEALVFLRLSRMRDHLDKCPRDLLTGAIRQIVEKITLGCRIVEDGPFRQRELSGQVHFRDDVAAITKPIPYTIMQPLRELGDVKVARYIAHQERPVSIREMVDAFGLSYRTMQYHVQRALAKGVIRPLPRRVSNRVCYVPVAS